MIERKNRQGFDDLRPVTENLIDFPPQQADEAGMVAGTFVATEHGWRPVETLHVGEKVMTFDHDFQPVSQIKRKTLWQDGYRSPKVTWPLLVPAGLFDNRYDLLLPSGQGLLIESERAMSLWGSPFVTVPVVALDGFGGITRQRPTGPMDIIEICFSGSNHIYAEGGAVIFCPRNGEEAQENLLSPEAAAIVTQYLGIEDPVRFPTGQPADLAATSC